MKYRIVMTTPPGPESQFIELEDEHGRSISAGVWTKEGDVWVMTIDTTPALAATVQAEREAILAALQQMRDAEGNEPDGRGYGLGLAQAVVKGRSRLAPVVDVMPIFRKVFAAWVREMSAGDGLAEEDVEIYDAARALVAPRTAEESSGVQTILGDKAV